ncbi:TPA: Shedu immune nuclease family protein [Vibrio mimicus]
MCRVRVFVNRDEIISCVLTDLGNKNPGQSITNSIEDAISALVQQGVVPEKTCFIEHYDKEYFTGGNFDLVKLDDSGHPNWSRISLNKVCILTNAEESEFTRHSLRQKHIYDSLEKKRHELNPYIGEPYQESFDIINRREDLALKQVPIGKLSQLVENGASEQEIQKLIKSDLTLMGDYFGTLKEEYICFSEFPINDGFVDFVVFTGRSRMEVTLIEIKGANYNLVNANSYRDFSAKTNQAVQQVRARFGYITRNYEEFRSYTHNVRKNVESGIQMHNSLIGPKGALLVDPNKDIILHAVVIGGRSKDDYEESRLRHEFEQSMSPSVRVESWDSWLKKSDRK